MEDIEVRVGEFTFSGRAAGPADGRLVLLLHGFPQSSWEWRHQLAALGDAGYRAVAPDQRGYSDGARPAGVEQYAMAHIVADVLGVADQLGGHRFDLVGHDWGAAVAWQVAGRYPQRVRTLTAVSVPHPRALSGALRDPSCDQRRRSSYIWTFRREDGVEARLLAGGAAGLRDLVGSFGLAEADAEHYVRLHGRPGVLSAALNWYRAASRGDVDAMGDVTAPTLYVWGPHDPTLGREAAEATAQHVRGPFRFVVLDGAGHWIPELDAARLTPLLLEHLAAHG